MSYITAMPADAKSLLGIWYLGQESIVLEQGGCRIAIDPYLSDYVDQQCATDAVRWQRNYPAPVTPAALAGDLHYVFCTHSHSDHTDPWTIPVLAKENPDLRFVASRAFADTLVKLGVAEGQVLPVDAGKVYDMPTFSFVGIPAAHEELHKTELGYAELSFRFTFHTGERDTVVFHGGDCCMYEGLVEAIGQADVLCLPVNGRSYFKRYEDDIIGNLTAEEAVMLSEKVGAELLIPLHYDLYNNNGLPAGDFVNAVWHSKLRYHMFRPGERMLYCK